MIALRILLLAMVALLSACASLTSSSETASPAAATTSTGEGEAVANNEPQSLGALTATELPDRSCGMILWTLDEQRPSPVFRYVAGKQADIIVGDRLLQLTRTNGEGEAGFGVYERQEFQSDDGFKIEVISQFGVGFDGGAYLERGLVKVFAPQGWSVVAPAAGIAGCRG